MNWPIVTRRRGAAFVAVGKPRSGEAWRTVLKRDPCPYCTPFGGLPYPGEMSIEHVTPLSKGGVNSLDNIVGAHRKCNSWRRDVPLLAFLVETRRYAEAQAWTRGERRKVRRG